MRGVAFVIVTLLSSTVFAAFPTTNITIGTPESENGFPFDFTYDAGTRYQQVYAASNFPGPEMIAGITFFDTVDPGAEFQTADYTFMLSTSNFTVNNLNTANLDTNPGPDAQLFAVEHLSGITGASFTITGTPFVYEPAHGDLLLDIVRANAQTTFAFPRGLDAMVGDSNGLFSRADNFGSGYENYGLVTGFSLMPVPEPSALSLFAIGAMMLLFKMFFHLMK
jgi:hypothetical protein